MALWGGLSSLPYCVAVNAAFPRFCPLISVPEFDMVSLVTARAAIDDMRKLWSQDLFTRAWNFASHAHAGQKVPESDIPYINHVGNVAMEVMTAIVQTRSVENPDLAVQCALLHDVIEDTFITFEDVNAYFGKDVADGVLALSKNPEIPKAERMRDSIRRIRKQPKEVWMVKLADRITNLQQPPFYWTREKINRYYQDAIEIQKALGRSNENLSTRLTKKIEFYRNHL